MGQVFVNTVKKKREKKSKSKTFKTSKTKKSKTFTNRSLFFDENCFIWGRNAPSRFIRNIRGLTLSPKGESGGKPEL